MPWFKVDDTLHSHPKTRRAGLEALGLWSVSGSYCSQYTTEGRVPEWFVQSWKKGPKLAEELVQAGMWDRVSDGWQFHDWDDYQMTKAEVERDKELNRKRQKAWRERTRQAREKSLGKEEA